MGTTKVLKKSSKRERTKYTHEQLDILEHVFVNTQYPDSVVLEELADKFEISNDKVSIWFQNRRSKFKKQSKDAQVTWMRNQVYNQENRPQLPTIPCATDSKGQPMSHIVTENKHHVLSTPLTNKSNSQDNKRPSSNLHYKPTSSPPMAAPISWEPNFWYNTQSPPVDLSSCATDILRDSNPITARPDYPSDIQFYGQTSPPGFWPSCMTSPPSTVLPVRPTSMMLPHQPFNPQMDLANQQFFMVL